ncbi:MAG TPA: tetratricopeptide repeat protein [Treponemataceae bacterium]|nr:tetratricopeptide repeat protein [Treponemataceae bacterium]
MAKTFFNTQFSKVLKAGQKRDYVTAITILEDLAARGYADSDVDSASGGPHPEIYLYLARSWHSLGSFSHSIMSARSFLTRCPEDGGGWFFLGRAYLGLENYERAVQSFRKSLELNPSSIDARALLGSSYLKARKPSLARSVFEEALTIAPDDERLNQGYLNALFVEAVRTYRRGEIDIARQMFTFLINNELDGVVPRLYLGHALRDLKYFPEAISQYEAARAFAPEDDSLQWYVVSVLLESDQLEAAGALIDTLGGFPGDEPPSPQTVSIQIIRTHIDNNEWSLASQAGRNHIKTWGSDAFVHALMGEIQRNSGRPEAALNHFRRAAELDPANAAPWYGILMLLVAAQDWKTLSTELSKAARAGCDAQTVKYYRVLCNAHLEADPKALLPELQGLVREHGAVPELMSSLARTYVRLDLADLAVGWYRKVASLESENEEVFLGIISCCEQLTPDEDLLEAQFEYLERWPDNTVIRGEYAASLAECEKWEEAADQLEMLSSQDVGLESLRQAALFRRKAGQYRKAAILYRNMLIKWPDDRVLLANLLYCLDRMGESSMAAALAREANKAFKPDASSLLIEGRLESRTGDFKKALTVFRRVIDGWPNDPRGWEEVAAMYGRLGIPEMQTMHAQKAQELRNRSSKLRKRNTEPRKKNLKLNK